MDGFDHVAFGNLNEMRAAVTAQTAGILVEPIQGEGGYSATPPGYLQGLRAICDEFGLLLMFDEVQTGNGRTGKLYAYEVYGVAPDICTFAKAVANGYPIAVVAGRREVMRTFRYGGAAHGGTYTAHAVSLAAAEECLRILDETPALETIAGYGEALKAGISTILGRRGIAHSYAGHPSMFGLFFAERAPDNYRDWKTSDYSFYDRMALFLHDLGVICEPDSREPWFICEAHGTDDACLAETLAAVETAVDLTLEHFEAEKRA